MVASREIELSGDIVKPHGHQDQAHEEGTAEQIAVPTPPLWPGIGGTVPSVSVRPAPAPSSEGWSLHRGRSRLLPLRVGKGLSASEIISNDHHQAGVGPEGGAGGGDGDPKVDLHEMGHHGRDEPNQQQLIGAARRRLLLAKQESAQDEIAGQPQHGAKGEPHADEVDPLPEAEKDCPGRSSPDPKPDEEIALTPCGDGPHPLEAVIESEGEQEHVHHKADQPGRHQGVEGLIVGAVRRGVAGFVVGQIGGVEAVIGHVHSLRTVADERADRVQCILLAGGVFNRRMGGDQLHGPLPDQHPHLACASLRLQEVAQSL